MKFNKLTIGFGAMALMLTSCDKAADQEYTPAAPVPTPAAYFSLDSDDEVIIDENQTEFSIPVYRANTTEASTVDVKCDVNGNYFTYVLIDADGNPQNVNPTVSGDNSSVTLPVTFAKGEGTANIKVTYKWEDMAANAGKEYIFKLATEGEDSPYFKTTADVSAMFIPWENVVGPKGETTGKFIDLLIYSGFSLSGGNDPFEFEVTIQSNPISKGIFRVLTPYANMFTNSCMTHIMYCLPNTDRLHTGTVLPVPFLTRTLTQASVYIPAQAVQLLLMRLRKLTASSTPTLSYSPTNTST